MPPRVLTSRYLQTNATVFADGLVVDAPYFPDELEEVAQLAGSAVRLFATHSHYDHLMMRLVLPDAPLAAGPTTAAQLRREPDRPQGELAEEDARTYVTRERPLQVADVTEAEDLALTLADGHAGDGHALLREDALCCGDFLSDVEIPLLSWAGSRPAYRATLERLEGLIREQRPALVVPGHGSPTDSDGALRRLEEDLTYVDDLADVPASRDTPRQREIHRANLLRHA